MSNYISLLITDEIVTSVVGGVSLLTVRVLVYHYITAPVTYTIASESARVDIAPLFDHQCV